MPISSHALPKNTSCFISANWIAPKRCLPSPSCVPALFVAQESWRLCIRKLQSRGSANQEAPAFSPESDHSINMTVSLPRPRKQGFTIIEIVLVLVLLGI
ncbi:type II secretion system protein, partial [Sutterella sp.]|uniref:type II secretion system protein n=1 Tax=Sutterella sp. TaxID=1981025 RepID=UPI003FD786EF